MFVTNNISKEMEESLSCALFKVIEGYLSFDKGWEYTIPDTRLIDDFLDYDDIIYFYENKLSSCEQKKVLNEYYSKLSSAIANLSSFELPWDKQDLYGFHEHTSSICQHVLQKKVERAKSDDFMGCLYATLSALKAVEPDKFVVNRKVILANLRLDRIVEISLREDIPLIFRSPILLYLKSIDGFSENEALMGWIKDKVYANHLFNVIASAPEFDGFLEKVNIYLCEVKI